jgi:hypothetical protein
MINLPPFVLFLPSAASDALDLRLWDAHTHAAIACLNTGSNKISDSSSEYNRFESIVKKVKNSGWWVDSVALDGSRKYLASGGATSMSYDGGGDVDDDVDCDGEFHFCFDDCEHMATFVRVTFPSSCSSLQVVGTEPCACGK